MEPLSTALTNYAGSKVIERLEKTFHNHVIERWQKHRAYKFFDSLSSEIRWEKLTGQKSNNIEVLLDFMFEDEKITEALFDAYRRVCFSVSRDIGPRIIAILTAQVISEDLSVNDIDEAIFLAAEQLKDYEFEELSGFYKEYLVKAVDDGESKYFKDNQGGVKILWHQETFKSSDNGNQMQVDIPTLDFSSAIGTWGLKLKNLGLLEARTKEKNFSYGIGENKELNYQSGTLREITIWLYLSPTCSKLVDLIEKAHKTNI